MSRVITPLFNIMNNESLMVMFRKAFDNLKAIAPAHNPFAGHLSGDEATKSRFSCEDAGIGTIADLLGQAELSEVQEGRGAILFTFDNGWSGDCGETVTNSPIPTANYTMQMVHGMLQPSGYGIIRRRKTKQFTICLTWEDIPGVGKDLALASVYPGAPDAPWNMDGLIEGQTISGQELINRGCVRVC